MTKCINKKTYQETEACMNHIRSTIHALATHELVAKSENASHCIQAMADILTLVDEFVTHENGLNVNPSLDQAEDYFLKRALEHINALDFTETR